MATIVNNPSSDNSGSGMGFVLGILVLIVFVLVLFYYGLPALRGRTASSTPESASGGSSEINVDVPDKVDVNVNGTQ